MNFIYIIKSKFQYFSLQKKSKELIIFGSIFCILLLYFFWTKFSSDDDEWNADYKKKVKLLSSCLDEHEDNTKSVFEFDILSKKKSDKKDKISFLSYIGNGYISVLAKPNENLYLREGRTLNLEVPFKPFSFILINQQHSTSTSLDIRNGVLNQHHCYIAGNNVYSLEEKFYAHRTIPSLLVHKISYQQPSHHPSHFDFVNKNSDLDLSYVDVQVGSASLRVSRFTKVLNPDTESYLVVVLQSNYTVHRSSKEYHQRGYRFPKMEKYFLTYVTYNNLNSIGDLNKELTSFRDISLSKFIKVLEREYGKTEEQHVTAWNELWNSGFGISKSLAQDSLNGDRFNTTFYYVLSSTRHFVEEDTSLSLTPDALSNVETARKSIYQTDQCYTGPHTLQSEKLWANVGTMRKLNELTNIWFITLEKNGCAAMLASGAEGLLQGMMLSLGGLKFSHKHLEMTIHPKDLHRDLQFRRINYDQNTHLSVSVRVGEDNRAVLYVLLDRSNVSFYACDAGCLDPPVLLSNKEVSLPVKLTSPVTSILYVASDLQHVNELKLSIHVQSIDNAPAHEHDLLALHRHGHKWGGLPLLFWVVLGTLIAIFHLFLLKLVYNEYCRNQDLRGFPGRQYKLSENDYSSYKLPMYGYQRRFS